MNAQTILSYRGGKVALIRVAKDLYVIHNGKKARITKRDAFEWLQIVKDHFPKWAVRNAIKNL